MSAPNYPEILSRRYPDLQWVMRGGTAYSDITMLAGSIKPPQAELDAWWPGVETELGLEAGTLLKERDFQSSYRVQKQLVEIMRAIQTNDKTVVNQMLSLWEVINNG